MTTAELIEQIDTEIAEAERLIALWREQERIHSNAPVALTSGRLVKNLEAMLIELRKARDEVSHA